MANFETIAHCLNRIATTGSTLDKQQLLRNYANIEGFKDVLKFIFDPYFTTGVGLRKVNNTEYYAGHSDSVYEVMEYFRKNTTGNTCDAEYAVAFIESQTDDVCRWAAQGLVTKDLQIGVNVTTLNKIYGKTFIPKIGIMRGMHCPTDAKGIYIATEKIDGNRRLIMNKPTGVEIYSRSGIRDYGLVEIEEQARQLPVGYVYDAECIAIGEFADNIELRSASASILNRKKSIKTGVKACVFDMLKQEEYDAGESRYSAVSRKALLAATFGDCRSIDYMHAYFGDHELGLVSNSINAISHACRAIYLHNIMALPILGIVAGYDEAVELAKPIWETGGEGLMLVEYRSAYEVNPNPRKTLLKIKANQEFVCKCLGVYAGDEGHKYEGTLGGIYVEYIRPTDKKNYVVKVGGGFPDYLRDEYWSDPHKIVGKMVEIESFGESANKEGGFSLNCPIFKRIKGAKE